MSEDDAVDAELVRVERVTKFYGKVRALYDASITVNHNEIVGLVGDNGAGKSTLIKVLSGAVRPDDGQIRIHGQPVRFDSTSDAIAHGIETIYQDSALVTELSIARNLFLGREPTRRPRLLNRLDHAAMNDVAAALLKQVGITKEIPPTTEINALSGGERQAVAVARAMYFHSELIILDEPTNNLGVVETRGVLQFIREARRSGHSCILIAHNIHHVFQVVDRIIVMRHGEVVVDDVDPRVATIDDVERLITGGV